MITPNTLTTWNSVSNKSNIGPDVKELKIWDDKIKSLAKEAFEYMLERSKEGLSSVTKAWILVCTAKCNELVAFIKVQRPNASEENINKVAHKFRGNIGEIFAEALVLGNYLANEDVACVYIPIDALHEDKTDASTYSSTNPNILMNIQVKNWAEIKPGLDIIMYLEAMDNLNRKRYRKENPEWKNRLETEIEWDSRARQILISATDWDDKAKMAMNDPTKHHKDIVALVGPKEIDRRLGMHPTGFFNNIIKEFK